MRLGKILAAATVAVSLSSAPALAQVSSASALSVSAAKADSVRAGAKLRGKSKQLGGGIIVPILVVGAVALAVFAIADSSDSPDSP